MYNGFNPLSANDLTLRNFKSLNIYFLSLKFVEEDGSAGVSSMSITIRPDDALVCWFLLFRASWSLKKWFPPALEVLPVETGEELLLLLLLLSDCFVVDVAAFREWFNSLKIFWKFSIKASPGSGSFSTLPFGCEFPPFFCWFCFDCEEWGKEKDDELDGPASGWYNSSVPVKSLSASSFPVEVMLNLNKISKIH